MDFATVRATAHDAATTLRHLRMETASGSLLSIVGTLAILLRTVSKSISAVASDSTLVTDSEHGSAHLSYIPEGITE